MRARLTWIAIVAAVWMLLGTLVRFAAEVVLQWVPFAADPPFFLSLPTLAEIGGMVAAAAVAYLLVKLVRSTIGAPADCWFGVVAAEVIKVIPPLVGVIVLALGARPDWLQLVPVTSGSGPVSLGSRLAYFVFWDLPPVAIVVFGAWRGSVAVIEGRADLARA